MFSVIQLHYIITNIVSEAAQNDSYADEDTIVSVNKSRTLESQPQTSGSSVDPEVRNRRLNATVDTEKGFVKAGESIDDFVNREKGTDWKIVYFKLSKELLRQK